MGNKEIANTKAKSASQIASEEKMSIPGSILPGIFQQAMEEGGFSSTQTIMLGGGPGRVGAYLGVLDSQGVDVSVQAPDGKDSLLPTYTLIPLVPSGDGRTFKPLTKVTHIVPAPYQVHAAFARLLKISAEKKQRVIVGVQWTGKIETRRGRQLNNFNVWEYFVPTGEEVKPVGLLSAPEGSENASGG